MRQPHSVRSFLRYLLLLVVPVILIGASGRAYADDRSDARSHYQAGVKYYSSGDYQGAIREFSAAQQLAPADLNNYNLALCYDKLGDAEPAVQYYRTFLDKQPNTDKRAEIEASISRLEAAMKSAASKKDEARKADESRAAEPPSPPPAEAPPVAAPPMPPPPVSAPSAEAAPPDASAPPRKHKGPAIAGSIGTPSTASPVPTGDSQLDRVNSINVDEIRDQRVGGAGSGMADRRGGPAVAAADGAPPAAGAAGPATAAPNPGGPATPNSEAAPVTPGPADQPKKETPLYKKWWFWGVVAVSAYVVYELATADSKSQRQFGFQPPQQPSGLTLLRW